MPPIEICGRNGVQKQKYPMTGTGNDDRMTKPWHPTGSIGPYIVMGGLLFSLSELFNMVLTDWILLRNVGIYE